MNNGVTHNESAKGQGKFMLILMKVLTMWASADLFLTSVLNRPGDRGHHRTDPNRTRTRVGFFLLFRFRCLNTDLRNLLELTVVAVDDDPEVECQP